MGFAEVTRAPVTFVVPYANRSASGSRRVRVGMLAVTIQGVKFAIGTRRSPECRWRRSNRRMRARSPAPPRPAAPSRPPHPRASLGFEAKLWDAADLLRNNMDPAEYKHVVLGLIFLKYISDAFEERRDGLIRLVARREVRVLRSGRGGAAGRSCSSCWRTGTSTAWPTCSGCRPRLAGPTSRRKAKQPDIGKIVDDAMDAIERENPSLKGVLPKVYALPGLDKQSLGKLIDLISTIGLGSEEHRAKDTLGRVYEYFLSRFASAEGKGGGEFYTPRRGARAGRDAGALQGPRLRPCCGTGGMFVQSVKFIEAHNGRPDQVSVYGQESNPTTWRLARMNLAIRGIEANWATSTPTPSATTCTRT